MQDRRIGRQDRQGERGRFLRGVARPRGLLLAVLLALAGPGTLWASDGIRERLLTPGEAGDLKKAIRSAANDSYDEARALLGEAHRFPVTRKMLFWVWAQQRNSSASFPDIMWFSEHNPDWPLLGVLGDRAEERLPDDPRSPVAFRWLERRPPKSGKARKLLIDGYLVRNRITVARRQIATAWADMAASKQEETEFLRLYGDRLSGRAHMARLVNLLAAGEYAAATRLLPLLDKEDLPAMRARLAFRRGQENAENLYRKVTGSWRTAPHLNMDRAEYYWKSDRDRAIRLARSVPASNPGDSRLVRQRLIFGRRSMSVGNHEAAYDIVARHGGSPGDALFSDSEFLAGFIAFRYLGRLADATRHFRNLLDDASRPSSFARAIYWLGRVSEARNRRREALEFYEQASERSYVYYGQLAHLRLHGGQRPGRLPAELVVSEQDSARFRKLELVQAARLFAEAGEDYYAYVMLVKLRHIAVRPEEYELVAKLAIQLGRADLAVSAARKAENEGTPLISKGYPVLTPLLEQEHADPALLHALARRESGFNPRARSSAGAIGMLQIMPATAQGIARRIGVGYSFARLRRDTSYNISLGAFHISELLEEFDGSYPMALAAYNAGASRVREWVEKFGDPRTGMVDPVDWIEVIPYRETRTYIQGVLEGFQIYQWRIASGKGVMPRP